MTLCVWTETLLHFLLLTKIYLYNFGKHNPKVGVNKIYKTLAHVTTKITRRIIEHTFFNSRWNTQLIVQSVKHQKVKIIFYKNVADLHLRIKKRNKLIYEKYQWNRLWFKHTLKNFNTTFTSKTQHKWR